MLKSVLFLYSTLSFLYYYLTYSYFSYFTAIYPKKRHAL